MVAFAHRTGFNAPKGWYLFLTQWILGLSMVSRPSFNAPKGWYLFLTQQSTAYIANWKQFQCPEGLVPLSNFFINKPRTPMNV